MPLSDVVDALIAEYGTPAPPPTRDPFQLVLLENVAYLATPEQRREALAELRRTVGTTPAQLLRASDAALARVAAHGILAARTVNKLRECARVALLLGGDLDAITRLPVAEATRALRRFPSIGLPGAEKILLLSRRAALLAPDSNGLRVLERVGVIPPQKSYARSYAAARALGATLSLKPADVGRAHLALQRHGQTACRRSAPSCGTCALRARCAFARRNGPRM